jgi:hypothetical protein
VSSVTVPTSGSASGRGVRDPGDFPNFGHGIRSGDRVIEIRESTLNLGDEIFVADVRPAAMAVSSRAWAKTTTRTLRPVPCGRKRELLTTVALPGIHAEVERCG